jgi:hypothetical protein
MNPNVLIGVLTKSALIGSLVDCDQSLSLAEPSTWRRFKLTVGCGEFHGNVGTESKLLTLLRPVRLSGFGCPLVTKYTVYRGLNNPAD